MRRRTLFTRMQPTGPDGASRRMEQVGVVVREEHVCDFCGKGIGDGDAFVGRLSLRKGASHVHCHPASLLRTNGNERR